MVVGRGARVVVGEVCMVVGGMHGWGVCMVAGGHAWLWEVCVVVGGMCGCRGHAWLSGGVCGCRGVCVVAGGRVHGIRRDTVNELAIRILLECILVSVIFGQFLSCGKRTHKLLSIERNSIKQSRPVHRIVNKTVYKTLPGSLLLS